jgi:prepilin-type N-terminal cleavage/methylation domain-containing protein/prepilin-type processing-associated H-X9-DG protein
MNGKRAFTLVELLVVVLVISTLTSLLIPAVARARSVAHRIPCVNNLRQWGLAVHLYAADHDDFLPPEGERAPGLNRANLAWYNALPLSLNLPRYHEMPWRTNASLPLENSLFICPANRRRATNNNLFHYCLNQHIDETGESDGPRRLGSIPRPAQVVYLFDNGRLAAVAQQNNVHTNLHQKGAQFVFLDGHAARFKNTDYWDFSRNLGRTNHPQLVWKP